MAAHNLNTAAEVLYLFVSIEPLLRPMDGVGEKEREREREREGGGGIHYKHNVAPRLQRVCY